MLLGIGRRPTPFVSPPSRIKGAAVGARSGAEAANFGRGVADQPALQQIRSQGGQHDNQVERGLSDIVIQEIVEQSGFPRTDRGVSQYDSVRLDEGGKGTDREPGGPELGQRLLVLDDDRSHRVTVSTTWPACPA